MGGDRFQDGDKIYFFSDFDLGDITTDAMTNLELLQPTFRSYFTEKNI